MNRPIRRGNLPSQEVTMLAFETSVDCVKLLDLQGTLLVLNTGGAATMGFEHPEIPVGLNWIEFWRGSERELAREAVGSAARGERTMMNGYLPTVSGEPRWWESSLIPVLGVDGQPTSLLVVSRDVTGLRLAEHERRRSERLFKALVEATSEIVWSKDANTNLTMWRGWTNFTGSEHDPIDRDAWLDAVHPDDRERVKTANDEFFTSGAPLVVEYRLPSRAGGWRWVEDHGVFVTEANGQPGEWVGVIADVHTRKMAEQSLVRSEERLRLAIEAAALGTWEVDLPTGEWRCSPEARRMIALPDDTVVTDCDVLDRVHPDDRARIVDACELDPGQQASSCPHEFRIVCPATGQTRWISSRSHLLFDEGGHAIRRVGTFADVTERRCMQDQLRSTLRRHEAFLAATSVSTWHSDKDQSWCERQGWNEFTGQCARDTGASWLAAIHPDDQSRIVGVRDQALASGTPYSNQYRLKHVTDGWRWISDDVVPLLGDDGRQEGWVGVLTDIHDRKLAEQALFLSAERLRLAVESTGLGTWDVDIVSGEREWSPEFYGLLRLSKTVHPARERFMERIHPDDRARVDRELDGSGGLEGNAEFSTFRLLFDASEERWVEVRERTFFDLSQRPTRRVGTMQDITDRKHAEREVWVAAHTDALTGVANRTLFQTRLERAVVDAGADSTSVCLLLVDLDRFKEVNDTMGHDAGDAVLQAVASRLRDTIPDCATVARLGGDEFGVIIPFGPGSAQPDAMATGLLDVLRQPITFHGRELDCSVTMGWSAYPGHDEDSASLLKNADIALYAAKKAGRGRSAAFVPAMRESMHRHVAVLRLAKDALVRDAVVPFYQPKVCLATGHVVGFEALLRWIDENGVQPPAAIQAAFDDPDLSVQLGSRMLDRVTADMRMWSAALVRFGRMALNVAAPEFHGTRYAEHILSSLARAELRPDQFEVEVTEGVLLDDGTATIATALRALHDAGVAIALDDFGTGYASLTHLKAFPVSWLKLDRSFVSKLERDDDAAAIVRAVIGLAHSIGIKVVAEGVETQAQSEFLTTAGCDVGQGYLFAKPMAGTLVPDFLSKWARSPNFLPRVDGLIKVQSEPLRPALRRRS